MAAVMLRFVLAFMVTAPPFPPATPNVFELPAFPPLVVIAPEIVIVVEVDVTETDPPLPPFLPGPTPPCVFIVPAVPIETLVPEIVIAPPAPPEAIPPVPPVPPPCRAC